VNAVESHSVEDLELELRLLPGVVNVGVQETIDDEHRAAKPLITLVAINPPPTLADRARRLASLLDSEADVEVVDLAAQPSPSETAGLAGERIALVGAEFNEESGAATVRLSCAGRVGIGESTLGPLIGGAEATLKAVTQLGTDIPVYLDSVSTIAGRLESPVRVALRPRSGMEPHVGIAQSETCVESAGRATLAAMNHYLEATGEVELDQTSDLL